MQEEWKNFSFCFHDGILTLPLKCNISKYGHSTIPHKTIKTNKKKPSPASVLSLGHIWASILTWGRGESILKESE